MEFQKLWSNRKIFHLSLFRRNARLTGFSMGGFGTWALSMIYPEKFAAIAPICGGGMPWMAFRIKDMPVWAFHGAKDEVVPLQRTEEMVEVLKKISGKVKFTVYPEAGHDSWTETYDDPELYEWFLEHRK
jgi:predicted peptidase